jgi:hypothetical protein
VVERGDLGVSIDPRLVIVLEGALAKVQFRDERTRKGLRSKTAKVPTPAADWVWSVPAIKTINDLAGRRGIPCEVVTFLSQEVADLAAEYLNRYEVRVLSCEYADFDLFTSSLSWRPEVSSVVDTDPERMQKYGQRGYGVTWGAVFV